MCNCVSLGKSIKGLTQESKDDSNLSNMQLVRSAILSKLETFMAWPVTWFASVHLKLKECYIAICVHHYLLESAKIVDLLKL